MAMRVCGADDLEEGVEDAVTNFLPAVAVGARQEAEDVVFIFFDG
jgi:hypothetical protein